MNFSNKTTAILGVTVLILSVLNVIIGSMTFETVTPDSRSYFQIASELPQINDSLFPVFYPVLLSVFNLFVSNLFVSSKLITISVLSCAILFFSNKKQLTTEILLIFMLPAIQTILPYSWSENVLMILLPLLIYYNYLFFNDSLNANKYIVIITLIYIFSFATKYSSVSILIAQGTFSGYLYLIKSNKQRAFIKSFLLSSILTGLYLSINYMMTGFITGERIPATTNNYHLSLYNFFYSFNPFFDRVVFGIKIDFQVALLLSLFTLVIQLCIIYKSKVMEEPLTKYIISIGIVFLLFSGFSYLFTQLNDFGPRLLMPFILYWYFIIFYALSKLKFRKTYITLFIIFSLINSIHLLLGLGKEQSLLHTASNLISSTLNHYY